MGRDTVHPYHPMLPVTTVTRTRLMANAKNNNMNADLPGAVEPFCPAILPPCVFGDEVCHFLLARLPSVPPVISFAMLE